jgi:class 3 adenylate cyclase
MANLDSRARARLPDTAFAYIDSRRRRLLPIHDEAHVRNALARFDRVSFEDEGARRRARARLLRAAKKHGIVPLGFMAGQLEPERKLPTGTVTFLLCDIEGSTALVSQLGDRYGGLLSDVRRILRATVRKHGGHVVDARADEFFAAFAQTEAAIRAALDAQRAIRSHAWPDGNELRVRMGIHTGRPTLGDSGYVGLAVHAAARVCGAAQGGEVVVSAAAVNSLGEERPNGIELRSLGEHRLRGLPHAMELFQVAA